MKDKIAKWYKQGLWTEDMVRQAVEKGVITEDEYLEIVSDNEKRWRNLLYGDSMTTNKVV